MGRASVVVFASVGVFVAGACVACTTGPAGPRPAASTASDARHAHALVWATAGGDSPPSTYALTDDGTVVSRRNGIQIWAAGTEWSTDVAVVPLDTVACEGDPARPPQEGQGVRVRLVPADAARSALGIVTPAGIASSDQANAIQQSARLLASLGPYVFVEDSTYSDTCGAHGNTGVSFAVWDLDAGRTVDLLSDLPDREHVLASGRRVLDEEPDVVDFSRPEDPPALTELVPHVGAHGRLEASALVTVASCYACTSGGWSSYTISTLVPVPLPWRLRALGPPPRAVGRFADAHPDLTVGGYSAMP